MLNLVRELDHEGMTLALMPNAGYPTVIGNRTFYDGDPRYFAEQMREMAAEGAMILGGCCGTAPVHIEMTAQALAGRGQETAVHRAKIRRERIEERSDSLFWSRLKAGEKVFAAELDPPADANAAKFMRGA